MRVHDLYCGNLKCPSRGEGRTFKVVDVDEATAGERALLIRPGATTDDDLIDGLDGVLTDGEIWLCGNCRA